MPSIFPRNLYFKLQSLQKGVASTLALPRIPHRSDGCDFFSDMVAAVPLEIKLSRKESVWECKMVVGNISRRVCKVWSCEDL